MHINILQFCTAVMKRYSSPLMEWEGSKMKGRMRKGEKRTDLSEATEVQRSKRDLSDKERGVKEVSEERHGLHQVYPPTTAFYKGVMKFNGFHLGLVFFVFFFIKQNLIQNMILCLL